MKIKTYKYETYSKYYDRLEETRLKQGLAMKEPKMNKFQFNVQYNMELADRKLDIAMGKRKAMGNIYRDIAYEQSYKFSSKQRDNIVEAINYLAEHEPEEYGQLKGISVRKLNRNPGQYQYYFDIVDKEYHDLRAEGLSAVAAKALIAEMYFGS